MQDTDVIVSLPDPTYPKPHFSAAYLESLMVKEERPLSFRARRKDRAKIQQATVSRPADVRSLPIQSRRCTLEPLGTLRLLHAPEQRVDSVLTCLLYGLRYANEFDALGMYLSLFELISPGLFTSTKASQELKELGYDVQVTEVPDEEILIREYGWSRTSILAWTKGSLPLENRELLVGISLYSLLVGKELNKYNHSHWVNKRAIALTAHAMKYRTAYFEYYPAFWSEDTFVRETEVF